VVKLNFSAKICKLSAAFLLNLIAAGFLAVKYSVLCAKILENPNLQLYKTVSF
jgi:hypothetical protein